MWQIIVLSLKGLEHTHSPALHSHVYCTQIRNSKTLISLWTGADASFVFTIHPWSVFIHWHTRYGRTDRVFFLKLVNSLLNSVVHINIHTFKPFSSFTCSRKKINKLPKRKEKPKTLSIAILVATQIIQKTGLYKAWKRAISLFIIIFTQREIK